MSHVHSNSASHETIIQRRTQVAELIGKLLARALLKQCRGNEEPQQPNDDGSSC